MNYKNSGCYKLREPLNYWCHQCITAVYYVKIHKGMVRSHEIATRLVKESEEAIEWD